MVSSLGFSAQPLKTNLLGFQGKNTKTPNEKINEVCVKLNENIVKPTEALLVIGTAGAGAIAAGRGVGAYKKIASTMRPVIEKFGLAIDRKMAKVVGEPKGLAKIGKWIQGSKATGLKQATENLTEMIAGRTTAKVFESIKKPDPNAKVFEAIDSTAQYSTGKAKTAIPKVIETEVQRSNAANNIESTIESIISMATGTGVAVGVGASGTDDRFVKALNDNSGNDNAIEEAS